MDRLRKILETKAEEVAERKALVSELVLRERCRGLPPARGFLSALQSANTDLALIAEVKKASPSQGLIRGDFDPAELATVYRDAGANCLSVLTDEKYFQGHDTYLQVARDAAGLPCLRKDFTVDRYQIVEARYLGADSILLIVAALEESRLKDLYDEAVEFGLDVLVEVHNEAEAEVANGIRAKLVGVNNRDLSTFQTDLGTSERVLPLLEAEFKLSESALRTRADLDRVKAAGAQGVLIGTTFCESDDVRRKVKEVMGW